MHFFFQILESRMKSLPRRFLAFLPGNTGTRLEIFPPGSYSGRNTRLRVPIFYSPLPSLHHSSSSVVGEQSVFSRNINRKVWEGKIVCREFNTMFNGLFSFFIRGPQLTLKSHIYCILKEARPLAVFIRKSQESGGKKFDGTLRFPFSDAWCSRPGPLVNDTAFFLLIILL